MAARTIWGAAAADDVVRLRELLEGDERIDCPDRSGSTALVVAASHGSMACVRFLVGQGAKLRFCEPESHWTALHAAVYHGHGGVAAYLVEMGCRMADWEDKEGLCAHRLLAFRERHRVSVSRSLRVRRRLSSAQSIRRRSRVRHSGDFGVLEEDEEEDDFRMGSGKDWRGLVLAWGRDENQLGFSTGGVQRIPRVVGGDLVGSGRVVGVSCGDLHSVAISDSGDVYFWGVFSDGLRTEPFRVGGIRRAVDVVCGGGNFLVLDDDGKVTGWSREEGLHRVDGCLRGERCVAIGVGSHGLAGAIGAGGDVYLWRLGKAPKRIEVPSSLAIGVGKESAICVLRDGSVVEVREQGTPRRIRLDVGTALEHESAIYEKRGPLPTSLRDELAKKSSKKSSKKPLKKSLKKESSSSRESSSFGGAATSDTSRWNRPRGPSDAKAAAISTDGKRWVVVDTMGGLWEGEFGCGHGQRQAGLWTKNVRVSCAAVGGSCFYAVDVEGCLWTWGDGTRSSLGLGSTVQCSEPVLVPTIARAVSVAAGCRHAMVICAITPASPPTLAPPSIDQIRSDNYEHAAAMEILSEGVAGFHRKSRSVNFLGGGPLEKTSNELDGAASKFVLVGDESGAVQSSDSASKYVLLGGNKSGAVQSSDSASKYVLLGRNEPGAVASDPSLDKVAKPRTKSRVQHSLHRSTWPMELGENCAIPRLEDLAAMVVAREVTELNVGSLLEIGEATGNGVLARVCGDFLGANLGLVLAAPSGPLRRARESMAMCGEGVVGFHWQSRQSVVEVRKRRREVQSQRRVALLAHQTSETSVLLAPDDDDAALSSSNGESVARLTVQIVRELDMLRHIAPRPIALALHASGAWPHQPPPPPLPIPPLIPRIGQPIPGVEISARTYLQPSSTASKSSVPDAPLPSATPADATPTARVRAIDVLGCLSLVSLARISSLTERVVALSSRIVSHLSRPQGSRSTLRHGERTVSSLWQARECLERADVFVTAVLKVATSSRSRSYAVDPDGVARAKAHRVIEAERRRRFETVHDHLNLAKPIFEHLILTGFGPNTQATDPIQLDRMPDLSIAVSQARQWICPPPPPSPKPPEPSSMLPPPSMDEMSTLLLAGVSSPTPKKSFSPSPPKKSSSKKSSSPLPKTPDRVSRRSSIDSTPRSRPLHSSPMSTPPPKPPSSNDSRRVPPFTPPSPVLRGLDDVARALELRRKSVSSDKVPKKSPKPRSKKSKQRPQQSPNLTATPPSKGWSSSSPLLPPASAPPVLSLDAAAEQERRQQRSSAPKPAGVWGASSAFPTTIAAPTLDDARRRVVEEKEARKKAYIRATDTSRLLQEASDARLAQQIAASQSPPIPTSRRRRRRKN